MQRARSLVLLPALLLASCAGVPASQGIAPGNISREAIAQDTHVLPGNASFVLDAPPDAVDARLQRPLADSIARGLAGRGWRMRPDGVAQWRVRYELEVAEREDDVRRDRALLPRMVCGPEGCQIRQDWTYLGPPLRTAPDPHYRQAILRLTVTDAATGRVAWQGCRTRDLPAAGPLHAAPLADDAVRLTRLLPRAPWPRPSKAPPGSSPGPEAEAAPQAPPSAPAAVPAAPVSAPTATPAP
ncbi:MAG TPA: hypothetical protein VFV15_02675 [Moraxellaceae bacterium]|nr:hypothetical protein [Moraxellaceae bacterium]